MLYCCQPRFRRQYHNFQPLREPMLDFIWLHVFYSLGN